MDKTGDPRRRVLMSAAWSASAGLWVPDPRFGRETLTGVRSSMPGPVDPENAGPGRGQLRWVRRLDETRLHLLAPAEIRSAATGGQAVALCEQPIPADGLTLTSGPTGELCMTCLDTALEDHINGFR